MAVLKRTPVIEVSENLKSWGEIWSGKVAVKSKLLKKAAVKADHLDAPIVELVPSLREGAAKEKVAPSFDKKQGMDFGKVFDSAFANALAEMLGSIPVVKPPTRKKALLLPSLPDCVELGPTRIVGAIRPQFYDAAYRPDGPRVVYDGKTLNGRKSIGKNWGNMVNDLTAEASTVHIRFPMCVVVFIVVIPRAWRPGR